MKKWSLSRKIWAVLGLLVVAFIGCVFVALNGMKNIDGDLNEVTSVYVKRDQLTSDIQDGQRVLTITSFEQILETQPEKISDAKKRFADNLKKMKDSIEEYRKIASVEGKASITHYEEALEKWLVAEKKSEDFASNDKDKEAYHELDLGGVYRDEMKKLLVEMNDLTAKQLAEKSESSKNMSTRTFSLTLGISLFAIIASLTVAFFTLRSVTRIINKIVSNLSQSSEQVSDTASQVASSSHQLSNASTEQAAALQETASSIEELNSMVAKNTDNAHSTSVTSDQSKNKASEGNSIVTKMISSMNEINNSNDKIMAQVNHGNQKMSEIVEVIKEIAVKTNVINDIVFQTKLLSFNASVEAARAGEHGNGFAVVAQEIGNLAEMSGKAAKEISILLNSSTVKVNDIVKDTQTQVEQLIKEGKRAVDSGSVVAHECGQVLEEIVQNVSSVSLMAKEIASASKEQSIGVNEITKAMAQLDQVTHMNSQTSEECATAAEELSSQAEVLKGLVDQLKITIQGGTMESLNDEMEKDQNTSTTKLTA